MNVTETTDPDLDTDLPSRDTPAHAECAPSELTDCPTYAQRGHQVFEIRTQGLPYGMWGKVGDLAALAEKDPTLIVERDGYGVTAYAKLTPDQVAQAIRDARAEYDRAADDYDTVVASMIPPAANEYGLRGRIQTYCQRRGIAVPWATT